MDYFRFRAVNICFSSIEYIDYSEQYVNNTHKNDVNYANKEERVSKQ